MSRRRRAKIRTLSPDVKYNNVRITRFINYMMLGGKKATAEKIVYKALEIVAQNVKEEAEEQSVINVVNIFDKIIDNVGPVVEVKSRRLGGATHQVPADVLPRRREALALRWIIGASRSGSGKPMHEHLSFVLFESYNNRGPAVTKRTNVHKMAESNKVFSHLAPTTKEGSATT